MVTLTTLEVVRPGRMKLINMVDQSLIQQSTLFNGPIYTLRVKKCHMSKFLMSSSCIKSQGQATCYFIEE